jgi:hypothetical protein
VDNQYPNLSPAFKLGQYIEAHASKSRREFAVQKVQEELRYTIEDDLKRPTQAEVVLTHTDMGESIESLKAYFPPFLTQSLKQLCGLASNDMLGSDPKQAGMLHSAIAGLLSESMNWGAVWHVVQIGRLSTRALALIEPIIQIISQSKIPSTELMMYVYYRNACMIPNIQEGTPPLDRTPIVQLFAQGREKPKIAELNLP